MCILGNSNFYTWFPVLSHTNANTFDRSIQLKRINVIINDAVCARLYVCLWMCATPSTSFRFLYRNSNRKTLNAVKVIMKRESRRQTLLMLYIILYSFKWQIDRKPISKGKRDWMGKKGREIPRMSIYYLDVPRAIPLESLPTRTFFCDIEYANDDDDAAAAASYVIKLSLSQHPSIRHSRAFFSARFVSALSQLLPLYKYYPFSFHQRHHHTRISPMNGKRNDR